MNSISIEGVFTFPAYEDEDMKIDTTEKEVIHVVRIIFHTILFLTGGVPLILSLMILMIGLCYTLNKERLDRYARNRRDQAEANRRIEEAKSFFDKFKSFDFNKLLHKEGIECPICFESF